MHKHKRAGGKHVTTRQSSLSNLSKLFKSRRLEKEDELNESTTPPIDENED